MVGSGRLTVGAAGLLAAWLLWPPAAAAARFQLAGGEVVEAEVLSGTRNSVMLQVGAAVRPTTLSQIERVALPLADGGTLEGELLGWKDGVFAVRAGGRVVHVAAGEVLDEPAAGAALAVAGAPPATTEPATTEPAAPAPAAPAPATTVAMREPPAFLLADGRVLEGRIIHATGSIVTVQLETGGVLPMSRAQILELRFVTAAGAVRSGGLVDWSAAGDYRLAGDGGEIVAHLDEAAAAAPSSGLAARSAAAAAAELAARAGSEAGPEVGADTAAPAAGGATAAILPAEPLPPSADAAASPAARPADEAGGPAAPAVAAVADPAGPPAGALAPAEALAPVEGPRLVAPRSAPAAEGEKEVVFEFRLDRPAARPLVILYAATEASAKAGEDFEATSGVITFAAGSDYAEIGVPLIDDDQPEASEQFHLFLSGDPEAVQFSERQIDATINDDD